MNNAPKNETLPARCNRICGTNDCKGACHLLTPLRDVKAGATFHWGRDNGEAYGWPMRRTPKGYRDHRGDFHRLPAGVPSWGTEVVIED